MPSVPNKKVLPKHNHKVKRLNLSTGNKIYFCVLPDCTFKIKVALSLGKQVICWRCENPFYLNEYSIRLAKPHCENCHKSKISIPFIPPDLPKEIKDNLRDGSWEINEDIKSISLADRLKKASQINHTVLKDESDEEL